MCNPNSARLPIMHVHKSCFCKKSLCVVPGELAVPDELELEVSGSCLQDNAQRTDEQLCELIRLHFYLLAEAHATQMTSDLRETETGPSIQCLSRVSSLNTITSCLSTRRAIVRTQLVLPWQITQHVEVNGNQTPYVTGACGHFHIHQCQMEFDSHQLRHAA